MKQLILFVTLCCALQLVDLAAIKPGPTRPPPTPKECKAYAEDAAKNLTTWFGCVDAKTKKTTLQEITTCVGGKNLKDGIYKRCMANGNLTAAQGNCLEEILGSRVEEKSEVKQALVECLLEELNGPGTGKDVQVFSSGE